MRLSFDPDDRAYTDPHSIAGAAIVGTKVYVDGVEISDVVTADDVEGIVTHYKQDADGDLIVVDDLIVMHHSKGDVRIELPDGVNYDTLHRIDPERFP